MGLISQRRKIPLPPFAYFCVIKFLNKRNSNYRHEMLDSNNSKPYK